MSKASRRLRADSQSTRSKTVNKPPAVTGGRPVPAVTPAWKLTPDQQGWLFASTIAFVARKLLESGHLKGPERRKARRMIRRYERIRSTILRDFPDSRVKGVSL